jgi:hypothetical protein
VARYIFQACPVWVYTQSNITQASYSSEYITPTQEISFGIPLLISFKRVLRNILEIHVCTNPSPCIPNHYIFQTWRFKVVVMVIRYKFY